MPTTTENNHSRYCNNSGTDVSEFLQNLEEVFHR